jgi:hypothetical protein
MPPWPSNVNSARVAGGLAPWPAQSSCPEPQLPVTQANLPAESTVQCVRPQRRPDHPCGAGSDRDWPGSRAKPVVSSAGEPELDRIPGHTVCPQWFAMVNVLEEKPDEFIIQKDY